MKISAMAPLGLITMLVFGLYGWTRYQALYSSKSLKSAESAEPEKHKVTARMLDSARLREKQPAPAFVAVDMDGKSHALIDLIKTGPIVLLFIKDGCPCSVSAEQYFNQMHASYRGRVRFFGVIEGDATVARRWANDNGVPFPIFPDPKRELIHQFGAENSAYVVVIDRDGMVDMFWPGYSTSMLRDLNSRIAKLSGRPEEPFDVGEAPDELYSGCPF